MSESVRLFRPSETGMISPAAYEAQRSTKVPASANASERTSCRSPFGIAGDAGSGLARGMRVSTTDLRVDALHLEAHHRPGALQDTRQHRTINSSARHCCS